MYSFTRLRVRSRISFSPDTLCVSWWLPSQPCLQAASFPRLQTSSKNACTLNQIPAPFWGWWSVTSQTGRRNYAPQLKHLTISTPEGKFFRLWNYSRDNMYLEISGKKGKPTFYKTVAIISARWKQIHRSPHIHSASALEKAVWVTC